MSPFRARRTALLFPGQGEESAGMAGAALDRPGAVRNLLARASAQLGIDLAASIRTGDPALTTTEVAQPALVAIALGLWLDLAARGVGADAIAGHSLGELAAFSAAGCLTPEDAVDLACHRGKLMGAVARRRPGYMLAIRAANLAAVEALLDGARRHGVIDIAAHNAPDQWVLSGEASALGAIEARQPVTRLPVSGSWHCSLMASAETAWRRQLQKVAFRAPARLLVANRSGEPVASDADLPDLLAGQLTRPVRWAKSFESLSAAGIERFITVGPSKTLRALCRANLGRDVRIASATGRGPFELGQLS